MSEQTNSSIFGESGAIDLGSGTPADFDPFAETPEEQPQTTATPAQPPEPAVAVVQQSEPEPNQSETPATPPAPPVENPMAQAMAAAQTAETNAASGSIFSRAPQFVYANATENIADAGITFEELRQAKETDFPELSDGKRVSWTVEYGKINKPVSDPKGTTIGKMKTQIEQSKEFMEALKKLKIADRDNVTCKVKPRVTAQSKGERNAPPDVRCGGDDGVSSYKAVFTSLEEAEASGKVISIIPARDGLVYERRINEIGTFTTPTGNVSMLSEVKAGFIPALPRIPIHLLRMVIGFFRSLMWKDTQYEALIHIIWDKEFQQYCVYVPKQCVTKVSVDAELEQEYDPARHIHVMDIHSHNSMPAKFT